MNKLFVILELYYLKQEFKFIFITIIIHLCRLVYNNSWVTIFFVNFSNMMFEYWVVKYLLRCGFFQICVFLVFIMVIQLFVLLLVQDVLMEQLEVVFTLTNLGDYRLATGREHLLLYALAETDLQQLWLVFFIWGSMRMVSYWHSSILMRGMCACVALKLIS